MRLNDATVPMVNPNAEHVTIVNNANSLVHKTGTA